jgi:chromosome segregation ATPase
MQASEMQKRHEDDVSALRKQMQLHSKMSTDNDRLKHELQVARAKLQTESDLWAATLAMLDQQLDACSQQVEGLSMQILSVQGRVAETQQEAMGQAAMATNMRDSGAQDVLDGEIAQMQTQQEPPPRALSNYNNYVSQMHDRLREEIPDFRDRAKSIKAQWRAMSVVQKQEWTQTSVDPRIL